MPAFVPLGLALAPLLTKVFHWVIIGSVIKITAAIGLTVVSYVGISTGFSALENLILSGVNGLPANMVGLLREAGFIFLIELTLSTISSIIVIKGIGSAAKRFVLK